ncbi:hypothetical protein BB561_002005 [Smittium simulii]|uniref:Uncharacterized protein n=1 Tax=Smittium simulii TaxID=133385 RepID=A0A2T9YS10_9FUNG|nr:hypothetical protein BB561_002005 [Smittium simulii]
MSFKLSRSSKKTNPLKKNFSKKSSSPKPELYYKKHRTSLKNDTIYNSKAHSHGNNPQKLDSKKQLSNLQAFQRKTISFHELPSWLQDNTFIHTGYRLPHQSYIFYIKSLGYLHNEFGNIWSHLFGCILFIFLMFSTAFYILPTIKTLAWADVLVIYCFLAGAVACLLFSSLYHTFLCHSESVGMAFNICDYIGIVSLIVGSCVPLIYYAFHCHNFFKILYISIIVFFGFVTILFSVKPVFSTPPWRPFRALTFVFMAFSGAIPAIHSFYFYGYEHTVNALQIVYTTPMVLFYLFGAIIYGSRVPERWFPGKFDIWFHSHQIFHYFVVTAAYFHYFSVINSLKWLHTQTPRCFS